jgi:hypothetical protein
MDACAALSQAVERAWADGLDKLSDGEMVGLMAAAHRNGARQAALKLAVTGKLAARRAAPDGTPGEHVEDEIAALLRLTGRAAASQVALAAGMTRLPAVAAALAAGRVDPDKAEVFTDELAVIDDDQAAAEIAAALVDEAARWTTGELRARLRKQIASYDPQAAARRKQKARKDGRVDAWIDHNGTGAIAARGMDPAAAIAADQDIDAAARWLQAHGAPGTLDQLRLEVFAARLTRRPLHCLLPQPEATSQGGGPAPQPGSPAPAAAGPADPDTWPAGLGGLGGSVNLTMPLATWLGISEAPGEAGGYGTIDAGTCRDLAAALAAGGRRARWCITLVDRRGRAVAHGCARAGPGPPGADRTSWLASVQVTPIETGTCAHRRESEGYRPSLSLRHVVKVRSPRCGYPGCRRKAQRCDDDHTIPHHKGGKTCECNLYPLCRRHHRVKQAQGWRLEQPEPGILIWTLPCGRQVTVTPEPYPV